MNANNYRAQLQALLPPGPAWPRHPDAVLTRVLAAWAEELARIDGRGERLISESLPQDTLEMLSDWERVAGLPDACGAELATTVAERRANLVVKLTSQGGASIAYFQGVARTLGYTVAVEEFRPFVAGLSRCGDGLWAGISRADENTRDGHVVRHKWRVTVTGARLTYFRTGVSQCADRLLKITRAEDLECLFKRLKPAHTAVVFAYQGE